jgi:flagellar motor switch protein FliM
MSAVLVVDDEAQVRPYDPLRHEVVDRAQLRRLHPLLEVCAHRMGANLSAALRRPVHVVAGELEQGAWDDFMTGMEDPTFIATALVPELDERLLLHLPIASALSLVEVLLGGEGTTEMDRTSLTEIEFAMVSSVASNVLSALRASLDTLLDINLTSLQRHRSAHFVKMGRPGETAFRAEASVTVGDGACLSIWLYLPLATMRSLLATLEQEEDDYVDPDAVSPSVERSIEDVPLELCVAYPPVHMSAAQILSLAPGDPGSIILLGVGTTEQVELDILAAGRTRIGRGVLVTNGKHAGCMVQRWERRDGR